jgi:hypothetical protein
VVALTTTDADNSGHTNGAEVGDDMSWLDPHLDRCRSEHLSPANDDAALPAHINLPALHIEMVRAVNFQDNAPSITEFPLSVEVAQPPV